MEVKELFSLMGTTIRYLDLDWEAGDKRRVLAGARQLQLLAKELVHTIAPGSALVEDVQSTVTRIDQVIDNLHENRAKEQRTATPNPTGGANDKFRAAVVKAIAANGDEPIAAAKLLARLKKAGVAIPGNGSYNNFSGYLLRMQKSGLIEKVGRGLYALPSNTDEPVFDEDMAGV